MSRVFLLSSNTTLEPYPVYPLGMAVIAGALAAQGHEVRQFDLLASGRDEERLAAELAAFGPEVIGYSLRNIDNVDSLSGEKDWYLGQAREMVALLRTLSPAPIVVGGPAFTIMPEEILAYLGADYGVVGEGERAICELVAALAAGRPVPALTRSSGRPLSGAEFGTPLRVPELVDFYQGKSGLLNLQTKRGCPFGCAYCTYPAIEGTFFRCREPRAVVDELERMQRDFKVQRVFFTDSVFNDPGGAHLTLAEELIRRNLGLAWSAYFRPQGVTREELALLKRAGLEAVEFGTDAASDTTLAGLDKGFSFAEAEAANAACLDELLPCAHFIIFGGPGETAASVAEGLQNIERLGASVVFAFSGIRILPGTGVHRRAVAEGVIKAADPLLKPAHYFAPGLDIEAMHSEILRAFKHRRNRIFPPSSGQAKLAVLQRFGWRGILWDQLVRFPRRERS